MRGKIDDGDAALWTGHTRSFEQGLFGIRREMQHLMKQHGVKCRCIKRQIGKIALHQINLRRGEMLQLGPCHAQHLKTFVQRDNPRSIASKKLSHPPCTRTDIKQSAQIMAGKRLNKLLLHLTIRAVQSAQIVPLASVTREVLARGVLARIADRGQLAPIIIAGLRKRRVLSLGNRQNAIKRSDHRIRFIQPSGSAQENPAAFAATLGKACIAQNTDMARHTRLALPQHLRQFAHRQFHGRQQPRNAQARRISKSLEQGVNWDRRGRCCEHACP